MKRYAIVVALWLGWLTTAFATGWQPGCITPISLGQSVNGALTTSDCSWYYAQAPQQYYYTDVYSFSGTAGQQVSFLMASSAVDTYLDLYAVNDFAAPPLASDDDGGGAYNARIPAGSGYFTLPATGTYYLWAGSALPGATGAYTLTIATASAPPPSGTPAAITVTEFYHPQFNHYFITAFPEEAASLKAGNLPPWVATGQTFKVWNAAGSGITNVCRFFNNEFAPKSSHFYSNAANECPGLATRSRWQLESENAFFMIPSPTGTCPSGTVPLYRMYNKGMSGAPNHRYTIYRSVRAAMVAAGWEAEGNGSDAVFTCVPPGGTEPPPPPSSAFQAEVTGYANTILTLFNGNIADLDQLTMILGAGLAALENPSSTCPVATSTPPLEGLETFPPSLTIRIGFGNGCVVTDGAMQATVSGSAVFTISNLVFTDTNVSGSLTASFDNLKINGVLVASGSVQASLNLAVNLDAGSFAGTVAVTMTNLLLPNGLGFTGSANVNLDSTGTTVVTTNLTSARGVVIRLNANVVAQPDGSVLVNTAGTNTVGDYAVQASNLRIDADVCEQGPIGGSLSFTKGGQTGTLTFNSSCTYTYSGP